MLPLRILIAAALASSAAVASSVNIVVKPDLVRRHFAGPGFQCEMFLDSCTKEYFDQVLAKRWRELNPGFARVMLHRERAKDANPIERLKQQLLFLKQATATEVYMTQGLRDVPEGPERQAWAKSIVDELESLLQAGATNVKYYCSTNELSLRTWGDLRKDMPLFRAYHQALYDEMQKRGTPIKLLSTDASPVSSWNTIEWASQHMDDISGVYGGHHYFNQFLPDDPDFYPAFKENCTWAANLAKSKGKDFILGEFGPAQGAQVEWGIPSAMAKFYDGPREPMAGLQLVEGALAAMNGGIYAMSYWTFCDEPDDPRIRLHRRWGLFRWMTDGASVRAPYYAYGLLTKFFHGPAEVHQVDSGNPLIRVAAVRHEATGAWSIAVVSRARESTAISIALPANPAKPFRKYVYDTAHVPVTDDGDLQEPAAKLNAIADTIPPQSLVVYTTAYEDRQPAPVRGLQASPIPSRDWIRLHWEPAADSSICYYRVYQNNVRIGSTTANEFVDGGPRRNEPGPYTVVAVDRWGNAAAPQSASAPDTGNKARTASAAATGTPGAAPSRAGRDHPAELPLLGLAHVGFRVADLEAARAFYHGVLGYDEAFDLKAPDGHIAIAYFKVNDNQFIEIFPGIPPDRTVMMTHVAFYTGDLERLHQLMEERGVSPGKINTGKDGNRSFGVRPPPGQNLEFLEFVQYTPQGWHRQSQGKALDERRISTHLEHAGIIATDFAAARRFFVDQLGFQVAWDYKKDGARTTLLHLRLPGASGDYVEIGNPVKPPAGRWIGVEAHIALTVPDIQAAYKAVVDRAYTGRPDAPLKSPLFGADERWQLNLFDPNGSRVEFMSPKTNGK
jgi:catechol 2,3-dioxygenase-like lactoylglutathione lyase family enzyme